MKYVLSSVLTIAVSFCIIIILNKKSGVYRKTISYRQSDMHMILKALFLNNIEASEPMSQSKQRMNAFKVSLVSMEDKAYWVEDNVFYVADLVDDSPDMATAQPIDTAHMTKEDIEKMLFILDNLDGGDKGERGSSRNE
jgi:hypothetical protein